jgi:hypothetical protein
MGALPRNFVGSTNTNPKIVTFDSLAQRIRRQLGEPLVEVEIANEQVYDNISIAIELFTKYAGYTEEYLVFKSDLYVTGYGLDVATMINHTPELASTAYNGVSAGFDVDLNDYRRVVDCFEFNYGESTGINTLFTLEQAMAQQVYSSYMVGNFGFDLTSWEVLKEFIKDRDISLAQRPRFRFDFRKQVLKIIPEPIPQQQYVGIVGCYIERPVNELITERWVFRYATALSKISVANVRGKYKGTGMFGGGNVNSDDFMSQGISERDKLEEELTTSYADTLGPCGLWHG